MKKLIPALLIAFILIGCSPKKATKVDSHLLYTQAAQTVFVKMTAASVLTPSVTTTFTPVPTATTTLTPVPSPTQIPATPTWLAMQPGKISAPIFLYYRIAGSAQDDPNYQWDSMYYIPPATFQTQLQMLKSAGYSSMTVAQLANAVRKGGNVPPKPFVITFDSAAVSIYTKAFPIMKELGYVGTVYAVVTQIDGGGMMTLNQIKELIAAGWEIGTKGMTAVNVIQNPDQAGYEISTSRTELTKKIGVEVTSYTYPGGITNDIINGNRISGWGFLSAVGIGRSSDINSNNLFYLPRYEMRKDTNYTTFASYLPVAPTWIPTEIPTATTVPTGAAVPTAQ